MRKIWNGKVVLAKCHYLSPSVCVKRKSKSKSIQSNDAYISVLLMNYDMCDLNDVAKFGSDFSLI